MDYIPDEIKRYANAVARKNGYGKANQICIGNEDKIVDRIAYGYRKYTTGQYVSNSYRNNFGWKNTYYQPAITVVQIHRRNLMSLSKKALLVDLTIGMPPQTCSYKEEADEISMKHRSDPAQARVVGRLFAKQDIKPLQQVSQQARAWFKEKTLPYGRSRGIIPAKRYWDFMQEIGAFRLQFNSAKAALINNMEDVLANAQAVNGTLFDRSLYPSLAELESKISFSIECHPVPAANAYDQLAELSPQEIEKLKEEAVINTQTKYNEAIKSLFERILKSLIHAVERLTDDDKGGKIFRGTLITNIEAAIEAAETLNIENDEQLAKLSASVRSVFDGISADDLRRSKQLRKSTAEKAEDLVKKISDIL